MRFLHPVGLALAILLGLPLFSRADLLKNTDFGSGIAGWHDDGRLVYLAADGTEADSAGPDTTPVIKLRLRDETQIISQDIEVRDHPTQLDLKVDVMGSSDFRRSQEKSDYSSTWTSGTWYWSALIVPNADFWIRGAPGFLYRLADVKIGQWTTVAGHFENLKPTDIYTISFCAPPGQGAIYLKNPSASATP